MRACGSVETDIKGIPSNSMFVIKLPAKISNFWIVINSHLVSDHF